MNRRTRFSHVLVALALSCIVWSAAAPNAVAQDRTNVGFIVLPFEDNSTFEGAWNIAMDVPRYVAAYLGARYGVPSISPVVIQDRAAQEGRPDGKMEDVRFWMALRKEFGVRFLLAGSIEDFDVSRFTTGTQQIGGYESFKGEIKVEYRLFDLDRLPGATGDAERSSGSPSGEFTDRSFALTLFGKPTDRTVQYRELGRIKFGSEEFNATVIGQACKEFAQDLCQMLEEDLPLLRSRDILLADTVALAPTKRDSTQILFKGRIVRGTIVFVEGDDAFVSIGILDGVQKGQIVSVYGDPTSVSITEPTDKIGTIELMEIRGPHLSLGKIKTGKPLVKSKQLVRVRVME